MESIIRIAADYDRRRPLHAIQLRIGELENEVEVAGRTATGNPGERHDGADGWARNIETGWRLVLESAPLDSHSYGVTYANVLDALSARATSPDGEGAEPCSIRPGWELPGQLTTLVHQLLTGRRPTTRRERSVEQATARLGVLALTLLTLQDAEARQHLDIATRVPQDLKAQKEQEEREAKADLLLGLPAVCEALRIMYKPPLPERLAHKPKPGEEDGDAYASYQRSLEAWQDLDFERMRLLRFGTTSIVLTAHRKDGGRTSRENPLVLKCVLLPYAQVPAISQATFAYQEKYSPLSASPAAQVSHTSTVEVHASACTWILMDLAPGRTLHDVLTDDYPGLPDDSPTLEGVVPRPLLQPEARPQFELLPHVVPPLLRALGELHTAGLCHADLNPRNIIVEAQPPDDGSEWRMRFIDLGRNHLQGRTSTGTQRMDELYAAPELRAGETPDAHADLYSLGQIIIGTCGIDRNPDGTAPDAFYAVTPTLARLVEDLIDPSPNQRLLLFPEAAELLRQPAPEQSSPHELLCTIFEREFQALVAAEGQPMGDDARRWVRAVRLLAPMAGSPRRQLRLRTCRRQQIEQAARDTDNAPERRSLARDLKQAEWLTTWAWLSGTMWLICLATVVLLVLYDLGTPLPLPHAVAEAQHTSTRAARLAARMTGITFALCAVKYYQSIYAGLSCRWPGKPATLGRTGRVAEYWVRANALIVGFLVVPINLLAPQLWTIGSAVGITSAFCVNVYGYRYAHQAAVRAREKGIGTIAQPEKITGLSKYEMWGHSMLIYVAIVWVFAVLLGRGVLLDILAYASVVSGINVGLFYIVKCSVGARDVRIALTRCYLAAERYEAYRRPAPL
ncbi:lipopolysaccharide kinase InaA family protein [Streptomyces mirabilis]|uniref:protein kinase domain-containing protein n=1 Tax=Streptomyces mirabilis TaxID=68239 RepID=UPI0036BCB98F